METQSAKLNVARFPMPCSGACVQMHIHPYGIWDLFQHLINHSNIMVHICDTLDVLDPARTIVIVIHICDTMDVLHPARTRNDCSSQYCDAEQAQQSKHN